MATIRTALALYDGVTSPLASMNRALHIVLNSFEALQNASGHAIDTASIQQAREELARAEVAFDSIEESIRRADQQQNRLNESVRDGASSVDGLVSKFKSMVAAVAGGVGIKKMLELSDELTSANARLNLIVEDGGSVEELEKKIMASAQRSRASYMDMASSVSKLAANAGAAFNHNNDEVIAFMEQVNKQFVIGGASAQEMSATMTQLTQAMGSGTLRGDELNSVLEQAPGIARAIESYMGIAEGSIKKYAEQGLITSETVKNALFAAADETNAKFESMPMTWAQIWTSMQNKALSVFSPILQKLNEIANSDKFASMLDGILNGLAAVAKAATIVLGIMTSAGAFIADNWSIISPVIYGVAAALMAYATYLAISKGLELASAAAKITLCAASYAHAAATGTQASATAAATAAQYGLNTALLSCPLTWILLLIIAVIAAIYLIVHVINKVTGSALSATGIIAGAIATAAAFVINVVIGAINAIIQLIWSIFVEPFLGIIEWILNVCNGGFDSFGDAVANLIGNIISWFLSLGKVVTKIIDAIFGTDWTGGLTSLQDKVLSWGKNDNAITLDRSAPAIESRIKYTAAWDKGYSFGQGLKDKVTGLFDAPASDPMGAFNTGGALGNTLDGVYGNTGDTAENTAAMRDSLDSSENELKYLREIAEREAINRFTTAELHVTMNNNNTISGTDDLDGIISELETRVEEAMIEVSEGDHI